MLKSKCNNDADPAKYEYFILQLTIYNINNHCKWYLQVQVAVNANIFQYFLFLNFSSCQNNANLCNKLPNLMPKLKSTKNVVRLLYIRNFLELPLILLYLRDSHNRVFSVMKMVSKFVIFMCYSAIAVGAQRLFPSIPEVVQTSGSDLCAKHTVEYANNLKNLTLWAYESK